MKQRRAYRDLVLQRIRYLFRLAVKSAKAGDVEYSRKVVKHMLRLSQATRVRAPRRIKRSVCKRCLSPLLPGVTSTVRLRSQGRFSYVVVRCRLCGWIKRYPYKPRRS